MEKDFFLEIRSGRRDNRGNCKWVSADWSRNIRAVPYGVRHTVFECVYVGFSGDRHIYMGLLKERHVHLRKRESSRSFNDT